MRKLLFLATLFFGVMGAKADDINGSLKVDSDLKNATLSVKLTNSIKYVAFQMDVTLPAGWTVTSAAPVGTTRLAGSGTVDLSAVGGSATESTKFQLAYNVIDGNKLRVIAYNLGNKPITGTSGEEIFTVKLTAGTAAASVDKWVATFSEVLFVTESDLKEMAMAVSNAGSKAVGESAVTWKKGDVNHDGKVNGADVSAVLDKALGKTVAAFYMSEADLNGDNKINGADVSGVLDIALGK
ncbi:MAG: dockerin type I repeat-containing protein [Bacteroidaceae bacterium]|nr:dockerin type I repeat-containing protein [Bacteroidaceae bacterium]